LTHPLSSTGRDSRNAALLRRLWRLAVLVLVLAIFHPPTASLAQDTAPASAAERLIDDLNKELAGVSKDLLLSEQTAQILASEKRAVIEQIRTKARQAATAMRIPIADLDTRLKQLGPAPGAGATEAAPIAEQRRTLEQALARFRDAERQLTLIAVEAEQLSARISAMQRDRFVQQIFESSRSILNPVLWWEGARSVALLAERLTTLLGVWYADVTTRSSPYRLALALAAIAALPLLTFSIYRPLARRYEPVLRARSPSNFDRLWRVTRAVILMVLVLVLLLFGAAAVLHGFGISTPRLEALLAIFFTLIVNFLLAVTFARTVLAPRLAPWRLPGVDDATAHRLDRLASFAALLLAIDTATPPLVELLFLPIAFSVGQSAVVTLLMCLVGIGVLRALGTGGQRATSAAPPPPARRTYFDWLAYGTQLAWFVIVLATVSLLTGYVALAHFVVFNAVQTLLYVSVIYVLRQLIDELIAAATQRTSAVGIFLRETMLLSDRAIARLGVTLGVTVDLVIAVVGIPFVLLLWTDDWIDIYSSLVSGLSGFEIAGVGVEPVTILTAIAILLIGLASTNLVTRWLDSRVLARTQLDKGVRDSVKKSIGYTGVILAVVLALTSAGVGFSNIALVAGALGVGIGFGLQSIVNNFVSGLILLAERPVKVGDWIVVGAGEGFVKQINVRSTEIETFDSCTIIVPNSSLIAEPVRNWTHRDTVGKTTIPVTVARDAEPDKVRDILLGCAKSHKGVMRDPEPVVLLTRFGESGLDFVLSFHVEDILWGVHVASDIRFAILKAFHAANVVMPYPQREVLMRRPASRT
jgi:small-conductance mechanosensitive channel